MLAWVLFGIGHVVWLVFDQWTRIGMRGPIYRAYNGLMGASVRAQGDGDGPWFPESIEP